MRSEVRDLENGEGQPHVGRSVWFVSKEGKKTGRVNGTEVPMLYVGTVNGLFLETQIFYESVLRGVVIP